MSDDHEFEPQAPDGFLDTLEGEIALFRSIERARPVGMHKHFHMLTLRRSIRNESGFWVNIADIRAKLATLYDLDALDDIDEQRFHPVTGRLLLWPTSWDADLLYNCSTFNEFALPCNQFGDLMTTRRAASPGGESEKPRKRNLGALMGDDSDLSDLTEGEDDGETDGATEPPEDGGEDDGEADTPEDAPVNRRAPRKSGSRVKQPSKSSRARSGSKKKKWIIEQKSEDSIALRNRKYEKYAGISGEPTENSQVIPVSNPFEFKVEVADGQHRYKFYVESGGQRFYMGYSMLKIYPPQCALIPAAFPGQPWKLHFLE